MVRVSRKKHKIWSKENSKNYSGEGTRIEAKQKKRMRPKDRGSKKAGGQMRDQLLWPCLQEPRLLFAFFPFISPTLCSPIHYEARLDFLRSLLSPRILKGTCHGFKAMQQNSHMVEIFLPNFYSSGGSFRAPQSVIELGGWNEKSQREVLLCRMSTRWRRSSSLLVSGGQARLWFNIFMTSP